ncbi:Flagellar basal-body rod protein FlgG [Buchnera aphidicola (Tetraneura ulmi)]|uniref:flagellar basal-body rod protein FlgG n=1 Tax=Buchnera aphidicola TaxID=9 RepID=UPI0034649E9E
MIPSLWIAKTGLDAQQINMDVISNNLANVSTNGFKRSRAVFEDLMYQTIQQPGSKLEKDGNIPNSLQIGTGVRPVSTKKIYTQGNLAKTDSNKDLSISGVGFFQIKLPDGSTAYTRDGSFEINEDGYLVNNSGFIIQPSIIIAPNALSINVNRDGAVSVNTEQEINSTSVGQINLVNFINNGGLSNIGENMFKETISSGPPIQGIPGRNGLGTINQGYIETSNVNVAEELVNMIQTQRAYEINSKSINSSDQMLQKLTQL